MTEENTGAPKAPFDFGVFEDCINAQNEGREIEIIDLEGRGTSVFFTVYGAESERYRQGLADQDERAMENRKLTPETPADRIAAHARLLSWCVKGWRTGDEPIVILRGEKLPFSRENAERVFAISGQVRGQVHLAVNNALGFLNG